MAIERRAEVMWQGDLKEGRGFVSAASSRAFLNQEVSWPSRSGVPAGMTSPEELIAAAHASCYAMALAGTIAKNGMKPKRLDVTAVVRFDQKDGKWSVVSSRLDVHGDVPGMDESAFEKLATQAKDDCPVSRALVGNVEISVDASLGVEELAAAAGP